MNLRLAIVLVVLSVVGLILIKNLNKKEDPIPEPTRKINLDSLLNEFLKDSIRMVQEMVQVNDSIRSIEIEGIISRTKVDTSGTLVYLMSNGVELAECRLDKTYHNLESDAKIGDTIRVVGLLKGKEKLIQLERCTLKKNEE